jgi:hypothetical protein
MVREWLEDPLSSMFWILAHAGMGKSAFSASLIDYMRPRGLLLGCFFCKYGQSSRSNGLSIITSLSQQLAENFPECRGDILLASTKINNPDMTLQEKMMVLIIKPLGKIDRSRRFRNQTAVIVIDALDEVGEEGSQERYELLMVLRYCVQHLPAGLKLLTTSRPDPDIIKCFESFHPRKIEAEDERHEEDLRIFIRSKVLIYDNQSILEHDDQVEAAVELMRKSEKLFIYMSYAMDYLQTCKKKYSLEELEEMLPPGLDGAYLLNFQRIRNADVSMFESKTRPLLSLLVTMLEALKVDDAQAILGYSSEDMDVICKQISNMFPISIDEKSGERRFHLYHKTVAEWLLDESKSRQNANQMMTVNWLQGLFPDANIIELQELLNIFKLQKLIKFTDISGLDEDSLKEALRVIPSGRRSKIKGYFRTHRAEEDFVDEMEYDFFVDRVDGHERYRIGLLKQIQGYEACSLSSTMIFPSSGWDYLYKHLIEHMVLAGCKFEAKILLLRLSWLRESIYHQPGGVLDVLKDIALIKNAGGLSNDDEVDVSLKLVDQSIIMSISELPSIQNRKHQYAGFVLNLISRLASLNEESIKYPIIKTLTDECMLWMQQHCPLIPRKYKLQGPGGPLEMTLRGHSSSVGSVCLSADGSRIISGSVDSTIKIWNAATGACEMSLEGHNDSVRSVCISVDGSRIISGSKDKTINIWNAATGACEMSLEGHSSIVESVCLSADGIRIISGSYDNTIKIWNAATGACEMTLRGHRHWVTSVCLSADESRIISGSWDETIKI